MRVLIAGLLLTACCGSHAEGNAPTTGNEIHDLCQKNDTACAFYVKGFDDGLLTAAGALKPENTFEQTQRTLRFCAPQGTTIIQRKDVMAKFLKDNPGIRDLPAKALTLMAWNKAWPCKQSP